MRPTTIAALISLIASPVFADMPLGITGAEFRFGAMTQDTGDALGSLGAIKSDAPVQPTLGFAAVNVAITQNHGFQGDALLEDGPDGAIGLIGTHLFMTPAKGQKYGLFATLADVDGEAVTYASIGAEGILNISPNSTIEVRGGIGAATAKGLDFIFVGARLNHSFSETLSVYGAWDIAEFQESDIDAIAHELTIGADLKISNRLGGYLSITQSHLTGTSAAPETTIRAGLTLTFGQFGGPRALTQPFHTADPVAQLVRRGYF